MDDKLKQLLIASVVSTAMVHGLYARASVADGGEPLKGRGHTVVTIDDITGDGEKDWAVFDDEDARHGPCIVLVSSAKGQVAGRIPVSITREDAKFVCLAVVGDLDGDEARDLAVGVPSYNDHTGRVAVYSLRASECLLNVSGESRGDCFGIEILDGEIDVDRDGISDVIVGATQDNLQSRFWSPRFRDMQGSDSGPGYVAAISGESGLQLYRSEGLATGGSFGRAMVLVPDLNDDKTRDFAVGSPLNDGTVLVCSGKDGEVVGTVRGSEVMTDGRANFGFSLATTACLDEGGIPDLAVGAPGASTVVIVSLRNGGTVRAISTPRSDSLQWAVCGFGSALASLPGGSSDEPRRLAVGAPEWTSDLEGCGAVFVYSDRAIPESRVIGERRFDHLGRGLSPVMTQTSGWLIVGGNRTAIAFAFDDL